MGPPVTRSWGQLSLTGSLPRIPPAPALQTLLQVSEHCPGGAVGRGRPDGVVPFPPLPRGHFSTKDTSHRSQGSCCCCSCEKGWLRPDPHIPRGSGGSCPFPPHVA